jgi:tetratricopeptide (TPR) repeat protein
LAAALGLVWPPSSEGKNLGAQVGARVVTRRGTVLRAGERRIEIDRLYRVFRVEQISGSWAQLTTEGLSGWANLDDVIPCEEAVEVYTREIEAHPEAGWPRAMRAIVYQELNEPAIALADFNEAVRRDPNDAQTYLLRGDLLVRHRQNYDRAITDYDRALALDPKLATAHTHRGDARRIQGDDDRALADYDAALRLDPRNAQALHGRGLVWQDRGDPGRAIDDLSAALRLDRDDPVLLLNLGNAWSDKHDYERALGEYNEAIRLDPGYVLAYNNRGLAWRAKKQYRRALADHQTAIRLAPRDASSFLYRGLAWKALGDYQRALTDYDTAIRLNPTLSEAHNVRAWLQATCPQDQFRNGKAAYDSAVRACTLSRWSTARDLDTLAATFAESQDFTRAVQWQTKALGLADSDAEKRDYQARLQLYRSKKPFRDVRRP